MPALITNDNNHAWDGQPAMEVTVAQAVEVNTQQRVACRAGLGLAIGLLVSAGLRVVAASSRRVPEPRLRRRRRDSVVRMRVHGRCGMVGVVAGTEGTALGIWVAAATSSAAFNNKHSRG